MTYRDTHTTCSQQAAEVSGSRKMRKIISLYRKKKLPDTDLPQEYTRIVVDDKPEEARFHLLYQASHSPKVDAH